jgi:hypothetical protein
MRIFSEEAEKDGRVKLHEHYDIYVVDSRDRFVKDKRVEIARYYNITYRVDDWGTETMISMN